MFWLMLDARVFWNQYFANQTGHLGRSNGLMMTLVTDWEEALMLRRYMWFGWGSCSFPLWRHGHKHSHTNTVSGDDMPKPLRVQSSNNVVMSKRSNGSKTSYCSEIWRENKAVFFVWNQLLPLTFIGPPLLKNITPDHSECAPHC